MKKSIILLSIITVLNFVCSANATVQFIDNFNVTDGGGDLNYQYDSRQTGPLAPISWHDSANNVTVTNLGPNAGKAYIDIDTTRPNFGLDNNIGLNDFSISLMFNRSAAISYFRFYCWNDAVGARSDFVQFSGTDTIGTGNDSTGFLINRSYPEFTYPIETKVVVSRVDANTVRSALFINNKAIPMNDNPLNVFTLESTRPTPDNYVDFYGRDNPGINITLDDFTVTTPQFGFDVSVWTNDSDSGISSSKIYSHTVNLAGTQTVINGVTFADGTATNGSDWEIYTASRNSIQFHENNPSQINVTGESTNLLMNFSYRDSDSTAVTIDGLTAGVDYIFTIYGMGFDPAGRVSAFASSDGAIITNISCDTYGQGNGLIVSHRFIAPSNGVFTVSTTQISGSWHWYAFSNEEAPPARPDSITATEGTFADRIAVGWASSKSTDSYTLFRGATSNFNSSSEISSTIITNYYEDTSITTATKYYYWVKACNTVGCSDETGPAIGFTSSQNPPNTPVNISPINYNVVTSPVTFVATVYSDPGGFAFAKSEWQVSESETFSTIDWNYNMTINQNTLTPPGNSIPEGTNFWRLRYKNEFNSWSSWSAGTSFIYIQGSSKSEIFLDTFNVPGSGDVNLEYDIKGRQFGDAAPLTYTIVETTETGSESSNPGKLLLGMSSGCSPDYDFNNVSSFKIEFDANMNDSTASDWFGFNFAKNGQSNLSPDSPTGAGLVFGADGSFENYNGENLTASGNGFPTNEKVHIILTASTEEFDFYPAQYSVFVNGIPMVLNSNNSAYIYDNSVGYKHNFISLYSKAQNSTLIDNLKISEVENNVSVTKWLSDADIPVDSAKVTHAVNINGESVEINGISFVGTGTNFGTHANGSAILHSNNWNLMGGNGNVYFHDGENVTNAVLDPNSKTLMEYFAFFVTGSGLKLSGLTPYSSNVISVFSYGWDDSGRVNYFSSDFGGAITNIDQDTFGKGAGIIVQYSYVANANGEFTLAISPPGNGSFHISGFCSEETDVVPANISVPDAIDFGELVSGDTRVLQLNVMNLGDNIVSGSISGISTPFSMANSYYATAATTDVINITFSPSAEENYSKTITLTGSGGNAQVLLTGTGVPEPMGIWIIGILELWIIGRKFISNNE